MREIKFRALDGGNGRWVYFEMVKGGFTTETPWGYENVSDWQQYTGLKDKNGKEIYEGDVVYCDDSHRRYEIVYYRGAFCQKISETLYQHIDPRSCFRARNDDGEPIGIEVIGNIYENPGLLTKTDKQIEV